MSENTETNEPEVHEEKNRFKSEFKGRKTTQVLIQEGYSLMNSFNPKTMTKKEIDQWEKSHRDWLDDAHANDNYKVKDILKHIKKRLNQ